MQHVALKNIFQLSVSCAVMNSVYIHKCSYVIVDTHICDICYKHFYVKNYVK
jgi:hypothetical protein